jgi:cell division septation protein DedD
MAIFLIPLSLSCAASALTPGATITLDSVIDTPDRTVTYRGTTYEITDIGVYRMDQDINASVNVTGVRSYQVALINKHEASVWSRTIQRSNGSETLTIPAGTVRTPGAYALAIMRQQEVITGIPVVISVYDLSISSTPRVVAGEVLHVAIDIKKDGVSVAVSETAKVMLSQGSTLFEEIAVPVDTGRYTADIEIPALATGNFSLYCVVVTDRTVLGYPETVGAVSYGTVAVDEPVPEVAPSPAPTHTPAITSTTPTTPTSTPTASPEPHDAVHGLPAVAVFLALALALLIAYLAKRR